MPCPIMNFILFHFIEQPPFPPPTPESGLRIIGSPSLICFSDLSSRYRNLQMEQEKKEEKEGEGAWAASGREGGWWAASGRGGRPGSLWREAGQEGRDPGQPL